MPTEYFEQRERALLGQRYEQLYAAPQQTAERGVTVSALRTTPEQFAQRADFPLEPSPFCKAAFVVHQPDFKPGRHPYHHAGVFYSQEPSASSAAPLLGVQPGMRVLDLCAAPGGKSSQLAAALQGRGVLVSNEYVAARADILKSNLERMGVSNAVVLNETPARIADALPEFFDRVLVDAPCSGEGMFRKEPRMMADWEQQGPEYYSKLQREIILDAADMLRPGGKLLYYTCTFSELENEGTIQYLLEQRPDMKLIPCAPYEGFEKGRRGLEACVRIFPHRMNGEGHFLALLEKQGEPRNRKKATGKNSVIPTEAKEFLESWGMYKREWQYYLRDERLYALGKKDGMPENLRYLRTGLYLGECKKKRFEPSQALAMVLDGEGENRIHLNRDDPRVIRYLKGETLDVSDLDLKKRKGWQLVCVDEYPLGWGKLAGGSLKNKYYAGWRWQ